MSTPGSRAAVFVAPFLLPATARFLATAAELPGVRVGVVTTTPAEQVPPEVARHLAGHWRVDDALDPQQIADAVRGLTGPLGRVERLVGVFEQLQVPLAQVREALGIPGMDVGTARNVRDKSRMKTVLDAAGVPCARHGLVRDADAAVAFATEVGFPLVAKPPDGAGAQATYRLDDAGALRSWLAAVGPRGDAPALLEEFLVGDEHTFDSVQVGGETVWASVADYRPPPLDVLRNPWIQWTVLLPRELDDPRYAAIRDVGPAAVQALGVRDGFTHMEWFRRPDGSIAVSEVGARPPGAQLASMIGHVHDVDFYRMWCALVLLDEFRPPGRRYAAGCAYLRGQGRGVVRAVHGVEEIQRRLGHLVVEAQLPTPGRPAAADYTGDGYVIVRHPETAVVRDALAEIVEGIRVELVEVS